MAGPSVAVGDGVTLGVTLFVIVGMNVDVNVAEAVYVAVREAVRVRLGVFVMGWNKVGEELGVAVGVEVDVGVGVFVTVSEMINGIRVGVGFWKTLVGVGMSDVTVTTGVGVTGFDSGASANASHPMQ
jgi:hypothetical protein